MISRLLILSIGIASLLNAYEVEIVPWNRIGHDKIFEIIKKHLPENPIIVEAGAFNGNDSVKMAQALPKGMIYAFEPDPNNFLTLQKNIEGVDNIIIYEMALSDSIGTAEFHQSEDPNHPNSAQSGSLLVPKEHLNYSSVIFPTIVEVKTITLDAWAIQNNIDRVDFLWFDMQGEELNALMAGTEILKTVTAIFTEVELVEAYANQYLYADVKTWLENQGFLMVAKDFEDTDARRWYGNILMIRKSILI